MSFSALLLRRATVALAIATLSACIATPNLLSEGSSPYARAERATQWRTVVAPEGSLHVMHPYLAARMRTLEDRSPRLRAEMEALRQGELRVYVGTPEQVAGVEPNVVVLGKQMPSHRLGEFAAVHHPETGRLAVLVVRINLREVVRFHRRYLLANGVASGSRLSLDDLMDSILIHEIWGHLIPVAQARSVSSHCPDPRPGQPDLESCVMQRENDLRREVGLRPRTQYRWSRSARF